MIELYCRDQPGRKWEKVPNGPFPITQADFVAARTEFWDEYNHAPERSQLMDCWVTTARSILQKTCPKLSSFDLLCIGNAIAMAHVKIETETETDILKG